MDKTSRLGITGVEIAMVLAAVLILVGILVYGSGFFQQKMRDSEREQMMKGIMVALEGYRGRYEKYPSAGTPIVSGGVVAGGGDFSSMAAALGQGDFLDAKKIVDPLFGALFDEFNGTNRYKEGAKFLSSVQSCQDNMVKAWADSTGKVSYAYFSDGQDFVMCLVNEEGKTLYFKNAEKVGIDNL